uniref:DNA-directed RNA polymerase subunit beta n=1 Tax=Talaromyces marneffei PM1 TaxID=1077442 RepID=A0A093VAF9_TALMA
MADEVSVGATQGIIWAFVAVSTIFTGARLYTRSKIVNKIGLDDYLMAFSLFCCFLFAILVTVSIHWGMGQHSTLLSEEQERNALLYSTISFTPGIFSFTVPKLGVTALLIRILNPTRRFTIFLWVLVGSMSLIIFGSLSAFLDLFLAIYPATVLHRLQMNRKKKLGLMLILGMGIFACAVSIYKATRLTGLDVLTDYTSACIPTVAPLLETIFGNNIFRGRSAERSSDYRKKGRQFLAQHNRENDSKGPIVPPAAVVRDSATQHRSRQGSFQHFDRKSRMSSTLISKSSRDSHINKKQQLSPTSPSYSNLPSKSMNSKTDVESQTSILDSDDDDDDDHNNHHHHNNHFEEDEDEIEMSHISRHDSFTIRYETVTPDPTNPRNEHNVIEGGTTDRHGRPLSIWRRSFSKYGYPGLSGYQHHHHHTNNHERNNSSGDEGGNKPGS